MTILTKPSKTDQSKSPKPFSLTFTNIRGLRSNFSDVESFLYDSAPDFLALCETNLNPSILDSDFFVRGYLPIIRKDSSTFMHGLGVYVRDNLPISRELTLENPDDPFMCFRLSLLHSTSYLYFLYRSPASQNCSVIDSISTSIDSALSLHPSADIFVFGDFNVHHSEWLKHSPSTDAAGINASNFAISQNLTQTVDFPTRFPDRDDQSPTLLDLFLSSNPAICMTSPLSPLGNSDHGIVWLDIALCTKSSQESPFHRTLFSYEKGDWDSFRDFIRDAPWNEVFALGGDECAAECASWIQAGIESFVPSRKFQMKPHSSPWFSPACAAALAHRNHFFHIHQREKSKESKRNFSAARNECKRVIEAAKSQYTQRTHDHLGSQKLGSRDFWRIYNNVLNKGKSSVPPLFHGPEVLSTSKDKAELFARQFSTNSTLDDTGHPLPEFDARTPNSLTSLRVTVRMVADVIAKLDPFKATGPDGIPVVVLQRCSPELAPLLSKLFNKLLSESCFPSCWKSSSVIPVYKNSGERSDPRNYRPISLLPVISKVFESIINVALVRLLDSSGLFSDFQYGFRASRSTADILTVISEHFYRALNSCGEARTIALDISKAFDKVWHAGLIHKLRSYGLSGPFLNIIKSFLLNRRIKVVLDGQQSKSYDINAGVPQGSVLGPTLFLLFINDLPDHIISKLAIYADDTTIYSCHDKTNSLFDKVEHAAFLEDDLRTVVEWGNDWLVTFNADKTKLLSINRYRQPCLPSIAMGGVDLPESDSIRLLGLTLSKDLSWNKYVQLIATSAAKKVGSLFRSRKILTPESILYLYKATIRPCIEYCCHLWAGASCECLNLLDRIQNRIVNMVGPLLSSRLEPLAHRRNISSLCLFYKYFHGHCSDELSGLVPCVKSFERVTRFSSHTHSFFVELPVCHKSFYSNSFFPRTAALWNSLPSSCFPPTYDLQSFKLSVNRHLSNL